MKKPVLVLVIVLLIAASAVFFACSNKSSGENDGEAPSECEHRFSSYDVTEKPTATAVGTAKGECSSCGESFTFFVPVLNGENYTVLREEPECEAAGKEIYTSKYGVFEITLAALGHDYRVASEIPPSCTESGLKIIKCTRCGKEKQETVDTVPHKYEVAERVEPSCTEKGYTVFRCADCSEEFRVNGTEYAHVRDDGEYVAATCPELGYMKYTCTLCRDEKRVYDESPVHAYDKETGICEHCSARCKHDFVGYACSVCGLDIERRVLNDGLFHSDANGNGVLDVGERVYFGFYPKSAVTDRELIATLAEMAPHSGDVCSAGGVRYVKKDLNQLMSGSVKFSDGTNLTSNIFKNGFFYRYEPIVWTVKAIENGEAVLESDLVIDVADYLKEENCVIKNGETYSSDGEHYACDWISSDLREFLNNGFMETAFDEKQKNMICVSVNGNGTETNYYKQKEHAKGENTEDFVFAAAYVELFSEDEAYDEASDARKKYATDYAIGSGIGLKNSYFTKAAPYYTRSVGARSGNAGIIDESGSFNVEGRLYSDCINGKTEYGVGIAPRVAVSISKFSNR